MSISSSDSNKNLHSFEFVLKKLHGIINALGEFKNHYDKKLNFGKLIKYLKIPNSEVDNLIYLILSFQERFDGVFGEYGLKKKIMNGQTYLVVEEKPPMYKEKILLIPETIRVSKEHARLLSDIIYLFKFVQKGKGFDLEKNGTQIVKNVRLLSEAYPYLFIKNGNNLTYPTEIGLELGSVIHSYNKSNKVLKNLKIKQCNFVFD